MYIQVISSRSGIIINFTLQTECSEVVFEAMLRVTNIVLDLFSGKLKWTDEMMYCEDDN